MSATLQDISAVPRAEPTPQQSGWLQRLSAHAEDSDSLSSVLAIFDQGMISGTNFLTAVVIGRCCGAETLGLYSLIASALALLIGVQEQLITAPYVMYQNRKRGPALKRYRGSILVHQLLFTVLSVTGLACSVLSGRMANTIFASVSLTLLLAAPAILLRAWFREVALAHCRVVTVILIDGVVCVSQLAVVITLFATDSVSLPVIYGVLGGACLLVVLTMLKRTWKQNSFSSRAVIIDWHRNWRFGRWALATHVAGTSTPYIMPWVLYVMHGEQATGLLASCSVIVGIANILLSGMSDFLTPRAAAAYADGGLPKLRRVLKVMAVLSIVAIGSVCLIALLFGEEIIAQLYDGRFPGAGQLVILLTFAVLANALGNVAGNGLWALDQPRANFVADLITLTSAIAAALVFVKPLGARGAAAAILVASVMGAAARYGIFERHALGIEDASKKMKKT